MTDPRYPILLTFEIPAHDGRPARTFQRRVEEPLTDAERELANRTIGPFVDALLEAHPHWTRQMAVGAAVSMILERFDDLDTYERVALERGVLPL